MQIQHRFRFGASVTCWAFRDALLSNWCPIQPFACRTRLMNRDFELKHYLEYRQLKWKILTQSEIDTKIRVQADQLSSVNRITLNSNLWLSERSVCVLALARHPSRKIEQKIMPRIYFLLWPFPGKQHHSHLFFKEKPPLRTQILIPYSYCV